MGTEPPSPVRARVLLVLAAVLWSLGSLFMRLFSEPTLLGLHEPGLTPLQIAFYRGLFAGLVLLPMVRPGRVRVRPAMVAMVGCFGLMSGLYLSALGLGPAANAILLQNTAPFWVYLIGVYLLGDPPDRRSWRAILVGMAGAVVIVGGNWSRGPDAGSAGGQVAVLLMAVGSGVTYAGVILFLRWLRDEPSVWLTVLNLLGSAAVLGGFVLVSQGPVAFSWVSAPTLPQLGLLVLFGAVQMAAPYWLFTRGLRTVGSQEAGVITLLEPVLNPIWAYLIAPDRETPTVWTWVGGALLLGALAWRYFPRRPPVSPDAKS
jgi:drug/metabolite transporter (DMT)-like permease